MGSLANTPAHHPDRPHDGEGCPHGARRHATETGRQKSEFGEAKAATVCRQNKRKRRELERERHRESMHSMSVQADRAGTSANIWGLGRNPQKGLITTTATTTIIIKLESSNGGSN